jgi:hypothetical protein
MIFTGITDRRSFTAGVCPEAGIEVINYRTRCEVSLLCPRPVHSYYGANYEIEHFNELDFVSAVRAKTLEVLNAIIVSCSVGAEPFDVAPVEVHQLEFASIYRVVRLPDFSSRHGVVTNHVRAPEVGHLDPSGPYETTILKRASMVLSGQFPFYQSQIWLQKAKAAFRNGRYADSVVFVNTSIEIFVRNLLSEHWRNHEGLSLEAVAVRFEETAFIKLIRREMSQMLGGNWNLESPSAPPAQWKRDLYELRNRVIHAGHLPTEAELLKAMAAYNHFSSFLVDRLIANQRRYPWLTKLVYGAI